jgi:hypothetical protein
MELSDVLQEMFGLRDALLLLLLFRLRLRLRVGLWRGVVEVELLLALGTEVVEVLDDPLADALLVEDVPAGEEDCVLHLLITDSAGEVVELLQLFPLDPLQVLHRPRQTSDSRIGVQRLLYL